MPILSLAEIASRATQQLSSDKLWKPSEVSFYVNIANDYVGQLVGIQHTPKEALAVSSLTSGGNRITYPSDFDYPLGLTVGVPNSWSTATSRTTTWKPLEKHDSLWADTFEGNLDGGEPKAYVEYATWLEIVPSPNSAYSVLLRYVAELPTLVASTATPPLDAQWHWAVVLKTAELLASASGDTNSEFLNRGRFRNYVDTMRLDQTKRRMDRRGASVAYVRKLS